jgi:hypothetical protein
MKSLHDAMRDPDLFGRAFAGPTFWVWRCLARFLDGMKELPDHPTGIIDKEPMSSEDQHTLQD